MLPEALFFLLALCNGYLFLVSWAATRHQGGAAETSKKEGASEEAQGGASDSVDTGAVLLVIAHPDDEAMFFVPTIKSVVGGGSGDAFPNPTTDVVAPAVSSRGALYILCLSNGNGDGLGAVRAVEMVTSAQVLGVPADRVRVLDDPALPDGMSTKWAATAVAKRVREAVEEWGVSKILTFDDFGVSGHPNHRDTSRGVLHFLHNSEWGRPGAQEEDEDEEDEEAAPAVRRKRMSDGKLESSRNKKKEQGKKMEKKKKGGQVYMLESTVLLRKYLGFFDVLTSLLADHGEEAHQCMCSLSPWANYRAMQAHASQFVWYRRLFVVFSRYTFVNNLNRVSAGSA